MGQVQKQAFRIYSISFVCFQTAIRTPFSGLQSWGGGEEEKFLPWFGGEPLRDPSRGVIPRGGLLLPSSARTEPRAARLKERSLAEMCCRSPRPEGRGTLGLLAPTVVHPPERPGPVGITTMCLNHCAAV